MRAACLATFCLSLLVVPPVLAADAPVITPAGIARHVEVLASDAFEGRAPATPGEDKTVTYLAEQFARAGAKPGANGGWFQDVPMVTQTVDPKVALTISGAAAPITLAYGSDMVVWSKRVRPQVTVNNAGLVFVGYGISAPEWGWDDYAGVDVRGKTVVILVNDPGYATGDVRLFNGKAMTYYGRWTYKFEEAARRGAAAALIVHQTAPAAYPWGVVTTSWTGPQRDVARADDGMDRVAAEGWLTEAASRRLFQAAGLDFDALVKAAATRGFKAVPMASLALSATLDNQIARANSRNVVALVPGRKHADEYVLFTAHWDHLGRCTPDATGDDICNGAVDNATGTAALIELAGAFAKAKPERSVLLLAVTGEESGLLGSTFYAANPIYPLARTVAGINMDALSTIGRTHDVVVVGHGKSGLETILQQWAARQGRVVVPEATPENGAFYRSDHFPFAKAGVPMLYAEGGIDVVGKGIEWGKAQVDRYVADHYHQPSDQYSPDMDLSGAAEDVQLLFNVGAAIANSRDWPEWLPSAEFAAARAASRAATAQERKQ